MTIRVQPPAAGAATVRVSLVVAPPLQAPSASAAQLAAANVERLDLEAAGGLDPAEVDRAARRCAAVGVGDLVVGARGGAAGPGLDDDVGERVGGVGQLGELTAVLGERGGPAHVRRRRRAALEVRREQ